MKYTNKFLFINLYMALSLLSSLPLLASNNEVESVNQEETETLNREGGYVDLGIGYVNKTNPFTTKTDFDDGATLFINARYQKNGLFIEFPHGSTDQQGTVISFGYNVLNTEHWAFDLRIAMNHPDIDYFYTKQESEIEDKRVSHSKLGLRASGYFDQTEIQFILAGASGNGDIHASAWVTRSYQYKNLNYYFSGGIQYRDKKVVNYFYGIDENSATADLPVYLGKAGVELTGQIGLDYPLSEHWVFESYIRGTALPKGISDSPLIDKSKTIEAAVLVKYVF